LRSKDALVNDVRLRINDARLSVNVAVLSVNAMRFAHASKPA
jgi:hypothetical protein